MTNVEYILTSEFDMDKGPTLSHQIPGPLPGKVSYLPELMLPDQIHTRNEDYTVFLLYRKSTGDEFQYYYDLSCDKEPLYCFTLVNTRFNDQVKRGTVIKSISIVTRFQFYMNFKPLLLIALDRLFVAADDASFLMDLYNSINQTRLPLPQVNRIDNLLVSSMLDLHTYHKIRDSPEFLPEEYSQLKQDLTYSAAIPFSKLNIPIKLPIINIDTIVQSSLLRQFLTKVCECSLDSSNLSRELAIYGKETPPLIILLNAMLTGKKIIFLGYKQHASTVVEYIFAYIQLVSGNGILSGFKNIFPFIDLSKIDTIENLSWYLVGTSNPIFKQNSYLWDVLYDLDANELFLSANNQLIGEERSSIIKEDAKFLSYLQKSLADHHDDATLLLIIRRHINEMVRIFYQDYFWSNEAMKSLEMNSYRSTMALFNQVKNKNYEVLKFNKKVSFVLQLIETNPDCEDFYDELLTNTPEYIHELLLQTYLYPNEYFDRNKGMEILLVNLFNKSESIRSKITKLIDLLDQDTIGSWLVEELNPLYKIAISQQQDI